MASPPPPIPPKNKRLATKLYATPSRTKSADDYLDPAYNAHARTRDLLDSEPPQIGMLMRPSTFHHEPRGGYASPRPLDPVEEIPRYHPAQLSGHSSTDSFPPLQTEQELRDWERRLTIMERMRNMPPLPGNTYGPVKVSGGARALRGDVVSDTSSLQALLMSRNHTYAEGEAIGKDSRIVDGTMGSRDFKDYCNGSNDAKFFGDRRGM